MEAWRSLISSKLANDKVHALDSALLRIWPRTGTNALYVHQPLLLVVFRDSGCLKWDLKVQLPHQKKMKIKSLGFICPSKSGFVRMENVMFFSPVISGGIFATCLGRWLGQLLNDTEATTVGYGTSFAGNGLIYIVIRYWYSAFECFWSMVSTVPKGMVIKKWT